MKKRIFTLLLMFALAFNTSVLTYAENLENEDVLLDSVIYQNKSTNSPALIDRSGLESVIINSVDPGYGAVKIDDVLTSTSGWTDVDNAHFVSYEVSKTALIKIIKKVPLIGDVYSRGEDIYNDLKGVYSIMTYIDSEGATQYVTKYSYRNFYHKLYVWDYNNSWYDAGYSLSRYFYKSETMYYIDTNGEAHTKSYDFTYSNGYGPETVAEAPHYMDKNYLSTQAVYYWNNNWRYVETY